MGSERLSVYPAVNLLTIGAKLFGNTQQQLSVSAVAAQTAVIDVGGLYDMWCDVDVYLKIASVADDVTTSTGYLLRANTTVPIIVDSGYKIGAIAGGAGTLRYHKVS